MGMRWRWTLVLAMACSPAAGAPPSPEPPAEARGKAPCAAPLPNDVQRGICYAHNYQRLGTRGYGSEASRASRAELKRLGVRWLSVTPFGFSRSLGSDTVRHIGNYAGGETDERVQRELREAHREGFHVLLKPHVWIGGGKWRGAIQPEGKDGWQRWFDSYGEWILRYARMAQATGVEVLSVGVEFGSSSRTHADRWRSLIARIRKVYKGKLTYSANWDEADKVAFWDALDFVGVQFYVPLGDGDETSKVKKLDRALDEFGALSKRVQRPVIFTELGYRSIRSPELKPHAWPEREAGKTVDQPAQARAYARLLNALSRRPWAKGVYFWKWFTDPDSDEEGADGFSPRRKLAASTLKAAYSGQCQDAKIRHTPAPERGSTHD